MHVRMCVGLERERRECCVDSNAGHSAWLCSCVSGLTVRC